MRKHGSTRSHVHTERKVTRGMLGARVEPPHLCQKLFRVRDARRVNVQTQQSHHKMAEAASAHKLDQLPPEMIEFTLLKTAGALAPRLGRLSLPGRKTMLTPAFIGNTSRGVIAHVSPDNFRKSIDVNGVYVPLEDCRTA
jgi:hypothetical protein